MKSYSRFIQDYYNIKKYNNDMYKLTYCKMPIKRAGFEEDKKHKLTRDKNDFKLENSIVRARTKVFEYAICNNFDYFITLTINKEKLDRYDLKEYIKRLGQFIRNYRRNHETNIQYLLVPEKHIDGAWHMHGLIKGIPEKHLSKNEHGYLDWENYKKSFGWCSIDKVRSREAVSKYITKYIRKSFDSDRGITKKESKLYYVTRGLKLPEKIKEGTLNTYHIDKIPFEFENDYVKSFTMSGWQYEQVLKIIEKSI